MWDNLNWLDEEEPPINAPGKALLLDPLGIGPWPKSAKENEAWMGQGACSKYDANPGSFCKTLFVSDLDGTLLTSEKRLLNGQATTLNHLIEHGLQFTVATARSIQAINALLKDVHLSLPAITLGGSLVTWPNSGEHLVTRVLPQPTAESLLTRFFHRGISPFVASIDGHRDWAFHSHTASTAAEWYVDEKRAYGDPRLCWYDHPSEVLGTNILSMTIFVEQEALNELTREMLRVEGAKVSSMPVRQFPGWHEVTASHPKADKGSAVSGLCQAFDSKWDRIVVFGDDLNDLPLFELADYAIAVANAAPEVLTKANQVIQSNDSGSVIDYLAQYSIRPTKF